MTLGGVAELFLGVKAEQTQLEDIAKPLTAEEAEAGGEPGTEDEDGERDRAREQREQQEALERRWRERAERRTARDRAGRRRYRLGPGPGDRYYSPGMLGTSLRSRQASQGILDREIDAIARVLEEEDGPLRREEIARRVGARRWGPGRFRDALDAASLEDRIRRLSRTTYAPA
jgi:hypothetical protein